MHGVTAIGIEPNSPRSPRQQWLRGAGLLVGAIAVVKLALHLYTNRRYGYFVDELYYVACARHLDWGYVDQPPLIALAAWLQRALLAISLPATRFVSALAGAAKVLLIALVARELGARRFAQGLAALCVLLAPGFMSVDHFLSMNALEPLFWTGFLRMFVASLWRATQT
jgi:4-amino-4-deoxy-L-arabinose transferase-like glycosyltransferase